MDTSVHTRGLISAAQFLLCDHLTLCNHLNVSYCPSKLKDDRTRFFSYTFIKYEGDLTSPENKSIMNEGVQVL